VPSSFHPHLNVSPAAAAEIMHRNRPLEFYDRDYKNFLAQQWDNRDAILARGEKVYGCEYCGGELGHYRSCRLF